MASIIKVHDCSKCKLHKIITLAHPDPTDMKVYHQIQTRIDNTKQARSPATLRAMEDTIPFEEQVAYYEKAFAEDDEATLLVTEWWNTMKKKYNLRDETKVDFEDNIFFECVDDHGVSTKTGEFIPKDGVDANYI